MPMRYFIPFMLCGLMCPVATIVERITGRTDIVSALLPTAVMGTWMIGAVGIIEIISRKINK